jgi:hypothetical protein
MTTKVVHRSCETNGIQMPLAELMTMILFEDKPGSQTRAG